VFINLSPSGQTLSFLASPAYRLGRHAVSIAWHVRSVVASLDMSADNVEILAEDDNGEDEVVKPGQMRVPKSRRNWTCLVFRKTIALTRNRWSNG
jgi:hypothetical protein